MKKYSRLAVIYIFTKVLIYLIFIQVYAGNPVNGVRMPSMGGLGFINCSSLITVPALAGFSGFLRDGGLFRLAVPAVILLIIVPAFMILRQSKSQSPVEDEDDEFFG